jgi:hypothetical protein
MRYNTKGCQPKVYSLVILHESAGWPGSILVAKANHFQLQQVKVKTDLDWLYPIYYLVMQV